MRLQVQCSAIVEYPYLLAFGNSARLGVFGMHLEPLAGARFHLAMAVEIRKRGVHVVVGLACQQLQRIALCILRPSVTPSAE